MASILPQVASPRVVDLGGDHHVEMQLPRLAPATSV